jgi:putative ABC transport system substrate-binding protein
VKLRWPPGWASGALLLVAVCLPAFARPILYLDPEGNPPHLAHDRFVAELRRQGVTTPAVTRRVVPADSVEVATRALVREPVDAAVVVTAHTELARAWAKLRPDVPVVLLTLADPRDLGFVASNGLRTADVTGFTYFVSHELKHVELLKEAAPRIRSLGILADRHWEREELSQRLLAEGPRLFGFRVQLFVFETTDDIPALLRSEPARSMEAWFVPDSPAARIAGADIARRIKALKRPSMGGHRSHVEGGGLMTYEPAPVDHWARIVALVRTILGGTPAREIGFDRPSRFRLTVSEPAARGLGLRLSPAFLKKADEVLH